MQMRTRSGAPQQMPFLIERSVLDAGGVVRSATGGALAYRWQGLPRAFIFVKSGKLSVQFRTKDRQVPWAECRAADGPGCMPVTAASLSERVISVRAVCTAAPTWIELSPIASVLLVDENPAFRHALFAGHAKRLPTFVGRISTKSAVGLDQRIADWLLSHTRANEIGATHSGIATDLMTAREVVSRKLKEFALKGWIDQNRGCIRIEVPAALSRVSKGVFSMCQAARARN